MGETTFRFKQFEVKQDKCAMKVNTDGVLLGAWAAVYDAKYILDVGTGTGVIALMMAQKSNALIDAIDIDEHAYNQARENFSNSVWHERLSAHHVSLQEFRPEVKYDIIISNPPYFIDDMKTASHRRNVAKHTVALGYEELMAGISQLLNNNGKACIVLPAFNLAVFETIARRHELFITTLSEVSAVNDKPPYLSLIQLERSRTNILKSNFTIQDTSGNFTDAYKLLTKDFYLKF
jgi:tRNA1Val (adenine37-N6)-methyltransferase